MPARTWVGRFCIVGGHVEEEGPWLGSLVRQRPDDDADELYVLVEPARAGSEEYTSQLVDVVLQLYGKDPLSLTGGLLRALRAAHDHLREWNRRSLREHRVGAGSSSLAMRGREAYLAQIGPSLAYVRSASGEVRRIEHEASDFDHALGLQDEFDPRLTRLELQPGDLVLLASTRLDTLAPPEHIERLLARGADEALPELYLLCRDEPDIAVVLLSCFEQAEAPPEFLTRDGAPSATADAVKPDPAADAVADTVIATDDETAREPAMASVAAAAVGGLDLPRRPIQDEVNEITAEFGSPPGTSVRLRGDAAAPRYRRSTGAPLPQLNVPRFAIAAVVLLALVGMLAWWQLPRSVEQSREERFAALVADARAANARAQSTSDPGLRRQLLTDAQAKITDAAKIHGDDGELLAIGTDVEAAIGVLNAVYEVREFEPIANMEELATGTLSVTRTVIGGGSAYLLDSGQRRIWRVPLEGGNPESVFKDGEIGFVTPGRPVSIGWSEDTGVLIILDDMRQVFGYFPDRGVLPLTVRGAEGWGSGDSIATSGGNLYVLDAAAGQVWRYLPGQSGYDSERSALLDGAQLADATEIAVAQDVYVLDRELGIRRFSARVEAPFPLAGIDRPLLEPASLSILPGSNRLAVADRGNKRIVLTSADGAFLRQIVSPAFTDLRAVAIDEGTGTLYVLNGNTLLEAPFPP